MVLFRPYPIIVKYRFWQRLSGEVSWIQQQRGRVGGMASLWHDLSWQIASAVTWILRVKLCLWGGGVGRSTTGLWAVSRANRNSRASHLARATGVVSVLCNLAVVSSNLTVLRHNNYTRLKRIFCITITIITASTSRGCEISTNPDSLNTFSLSIKP